MNWLEHRKSCLQSIHQYRYIRDWVFGNSVNQFSAWVEIKAFMVSPKNTSDLDDNIYNVALHKTLSSNYVIILPGSGQQAYNLAVDGSLDSNNYSSVLDTSYSAVYLQVDLGQLYDIKTVGIWHYYLDGRTYHNTKTQVSSDGVNWITLFDSAISGEYIETANGHIMNL